MSEMVEDLLVRAIAFAQTGDKDTARFFLDRALSEDADFGQQARAWLWLSRVSDDPNEKRRCLERCLQFGLGNPEARRELAILRGQLKPEEIIDPLRPVEPAKPSPSGEPSEARRSICPNCAGRLTFHPERHALVCEYCGYQVSESEAAANAPPVREQDFAVTMVTAKGHRWEIPNERMLECSGCGAIFTLPPSQISGNCPFCGSAEVSVAAARQDLVEPAAIVPFQFEAGRALAFARRWLENQRFRPRGLDERALVRLPRPIYLPYWAFDFGGAVNWRGLVNEGDDENPRWVPQTGTELVSRFDVLVPATHTLPAEQVAGISGDFDLQTIVPYALDLLAGWPAEIYQISMADASLVARDRTFDDAREAIRSEFTAGRDLVCDSSGIQIYDFKLVLLPVWSTEYSYQEKRYPVLVNGQTGAAHGVVPRSGVQKLLGGLFGSA